jgi:geranylgeranyl pyrophosphate synthase
MMKKFPYPNKEQEKMIEELQRLMEERGRKPLDMARKAVMEEKIECKEASEALHYFINECWHDLARPTLLSLCCEAVGGDPDATIPFAVSLSLISGGIDIHDDIIDQSEIKNGRSTVYGKFGKDIALLVGDALLFKGLTLLTEAGKNIDKKKIVAISRILKTMFFELGDAEAIELKLRKRLDVSPDEYLDIVEKKAADVEAHAHISAILGNGTQREIASLSKYGRTLGKLLILGDDDIDMANPEELLNRIKKEHLPLPLLYALQDPKTKPKIAAILKKENITTGDAKRIFEIVYNCRAFTEVEDLMKELVRTGINELDNVKNCREKLEVLIVTTLVEWK